MSQDAMPRSQDRSERIEARVTPEVLALVRRAAELQGRSVSEFVASAAEQEAREVIERTEVIHLSPEDSRRFAEALLSPPEPTPAMVRAVEHHRRLFGGA